MLTLTQTKVSPQKILALLLGVTVAVSTTNVLYSLTDTPTRGFDFHYSEILMIMTLGLGWFFKELKAPQSPITMICSFFIISTLFSDDSILSVYSSLKFSLIFLGVSSLRGLISKDLRPYLGIPLLIVVLAHIVAAGYQAEVLGAVRPAGLSGNPNLLAGIGLVMGGPMLGALVIGLTGSRAVLLALVLTLPLIWREFGLRSAIKSLLILVLSIGMFTLMFGSFGRVIQTIPAIRDLPSSQISRGSPEGFSDPNRIQQWSSAIRGISLVGTGFDTQTGIGVNPHNIYLIILREMGWIISIPVLGLL